MDELVPRPVPRPVPCPVPFALRLFPLTFCFRFVPSPFFTND